MDNQHGYPHPPPKYTPHSMPPQSFPVQYAPGMMPEPPVIVQQPAQIVIHQNPPVGPAPTMVVCPSCRQNVCTRLEYEPSTRTHLVALILCLLQCYCCCCIPYCMDSCQNGIHSCPNCGTHIGTYTS